MSTRQVRVVRPQTPTAKCGFLRRSPPHGLWTRRQNTLHGVHSAWPVRKRRSVHLFIGISRAYGACGRVTATNTAPMSTKSACTTSPTSPS
eukprot:08881_4